MDHAKNVRCGQQIEKSLHLLKEVLGSDLLGVYLFGSAIVGGLQKYSDLDLLVVSERATTYEEKSKLVASLLHISGIYMKSSKLPIEMTVVVKSAVNPWRYPPQFDFQYGEWLRSEFESGNMEPWPTKEMPDLVVVITQVLLKSQTLFGVDAHKLLSDVPYRDFMKANMHGVKDLMVNLDQDTRNVLLTLARIWRNVEKDTICSKPVAADWAINRLPIEYKGVMQRAKAICMGEEDEHWDDIKALVQPCADFMMNKINAQIPDVESLEGMNKAIKLDE